MTHEQDEARAVARLTVRLLYGWIAVVWSTGLAEVVWLAA